MTYNEAETRFHLIDPILRQKGYGDHQRLKLEAPAPVEPTGPRGRRRRGSGRTDYLLCVQVGETPWPLPVAVLEAKRETEDPLTGGGNYFDELLARIRDIRSSEKVFWRKVLDIYATSIE